MTSSRSPLELAERRLLMLLAGGVMLPLLDIAMIAPALPLMTEDMQIARSGQPSHGLLVAAQGLAAAASVPLTGWLGVRYGPHRVWMHALGLYIAGLLLAALATSMPMLIAGRLAQGAAAGLLAPIMQTMVSRLVARDRLSAAMGFISVPTVLAPILGPMIGGVVTHWLGWRWLFWLQVPLVGLALFAAMRWMPRHVTLSSKALDVVGLSLLCPGFVLLVHGLVSVSTSSTGVVEVAMAILLLAGYLLHARRLGRKALLDIHVFGDGMFGPAAALLLLASAVLYGGLLWFPMLLEQTGQWSVLAIGAVMAAHGIGILAARAGLGYAVRLVGARATATLAVLCVVLGGVMVALPSGLASTGWVLCALVLRGGGLGGAVAVPLVLAATAAGHAWAGNDGVLAGHLVLLLLTAASVCPVLRVTGPGVTVRTG